MSFFDFLGLGGGREDGAAGGETETVRKIVDQLDGMETERARFVAALAYVLARVAWADREFDRSERRSMEEIVRREGGLSEQQAVLVVQMAKSQNQLFGGTENFLVTRELKDVAGDEERRRLLDCLFAVSAADDSVSGVEEAHVRQIASELGFTHREYVAARRRYSDQRTVLRGLSPSDDD